MGIRLEEPVSASEGRALLFLVIVFGLTVFSGAFLLFQVEPLIGKYILPWFGSAPGVWTTCLLFFQIMLLAGYFYAHKLITRLSPRFQVFTHLLLLLCAVLLLPITPSGKWLTGSVSGDPTVQILLVLTASVGAPYFLLSSTAPLMQAWFARIAPGHSPYRLYALSNAASMIALLSYPVVIERFIPLKSQTLWWSVAFAGFSVLNVICAVWAARASSDPGKASGEVAAQNEDAGSPGVLRVALWMILAACGSGLLMAMTNRFSTDVAVVPLLWILPLAIYLLTFVIAFDREAWFVKPLFFGLLPIAIGMAGLSLARGSEQAIAPQILGGSFILFITLMCCHGQLAALRPHSKDLTLYYLAIAFGGALGGLFVAIIGPLIFSDLWEYHLLLAATAILSIMTFLPEATAWMRSREGWIQKSPGSLLVVPGVLLGALTTGLLFFLPPSFLPLNDMAEPIGKVDFLFWLSAGFVLLTAAVLILRISPVQGTGQVHAGEAHTGKRLVTVVFLSATLAFIPALGSLAFDYHKGRDLLLVRERNFFGTLEIFKFDTGISKSLILKHGRIIHGFQFLKPTMRSFPTSYFGPKSGLGIAIRRQPERWTEGRQFRIGVIGLGVGTTAAYANQAVLETPGRYVGPRKRKVGDFLEVYEIDPLDVDWAERYFSYLQDARDRGAELRISPGDARIVLERQLRDQHPQHFDVMVVDAFNSDAIPIHLLTRECFRIYWEHLNRDGVLAVHVSNRHLDLAPVVFRLAREMGKRAMIVNSTSYPPTGVYESSWVVVSSNQAFWEDPEVRLYSRFVAEPGPLWTDDFSSIIPVLKNKPW